MLSVNINGNDYPLAATLRVAYKIQGQHNHKPYAEVFKNIGEMHIEDQVGIVFAAFECANLNMLHPIKRQDFLEYYLDNYNLHHLMRQIQAIVEGIMGKDFMESANTSTDASEDNEKN